MVATWRWPKLLYSALSISLTCTPSCVARSLSMLTKVSTPFSAWSVSTSIRAGCSFIWSASFAAHFFKSAWLSLIRVYW
ncbi:hypothetical protein D3C72_1185840 [compost metagenome]